MAFNFFDRYDIKKLFDDYQISFQKKFGQNFLLNSQIVDDIVDAMQLTKDDFVIEIGAGIGTFTHKLLETGAIVQCYEIDYKFADILKSFFGINPNFRLVVGDFLKTFYKSSKDFPKDKRIVIFGSLPYYISTPILEKIFYSGVNFDFINIIVQSEMQSRITALPNDEHYCHLSLLINTFSIPKVIKEIASSNFVPEPNVDSIVVQMKRQNRNIDNLTVYFSLAREIFRNRRKKLINNLMTNSIFQQIPKTELLAMLENINQNENIRGEALDISQIVELSNMLNNKIGEQK